MRFQPRNGLITLLSGWLAIQSISSVSWAAETQVRDIHLNSAGDIVLVVNGDGFDPQFSTRPLPDGAFQITITGSGVTLNGPEQTALSSALSSQIPAILNCLLASDKTGFQLNLTVDHRLQPQIRSNNGQHIVIALMGDHHAAPERLAKQQRAIAQQKQAEIDQQRQAALARQQKQKADEQRAILQRQKAAAQQLMLKKQTEAANRAKPHIPSIATGPSAIDTDWQTTDPAEVPMSLMAVDTPTDPQKTGDAMENDPVVSLNLPVHQRANGGYDIDFPRNLNHPLVPDQLAQHIIPNAPKPPDFTKLSQANALPVQEEPEQAPSNPIRLKSTPANYQLDDPGQPGPMPSVEKTGSFSEYAPFKEATLIRAWQDLQNGNTDGAELGLRSFLERSPSNVEARYLLAQTLLKPVRATPPGSPTVDQSRREAARQALLTVVNQQPFLPAYISLLDLYLADQNWTDTGRLLEKVAPLYPQESRIWTAKGRWLEGKADWSGAQVAYTQALALSPQHAETHYRLAQVYLQSGNPKACEWELLQVLAIAPDDARCWKLLGYLAEQQGDTAKATLLYRESLQPDVMLNYARLLENQNQVTEALAMYQAVESLAHTDPDLLFQLVLTYNRLKKTTRSEATFKRLNELVQDKQDTRLVQARTVLKKIK